MLIEHKVQSREWTETEHSGEVSSVKTSNTFNLLDLLHSINVVRVAVLFKVSLNLTPLLDHVDRYKYGARYGLCEHATRQVSHERMILQVLELQRILFEPLIATEV